MFPGTVLIIPCPLCGQQGRKRTSSSEKYSKPELWSDGKRISSCNKDYPRLVKCTKCGHFFYANEEDSIHTINYNDEDRAYWDKVPYLHLPSFEEYFEGLGTEVFEKYLRWEALHCYNDFIRNNREAEITTDMQDLYHDNLVSMLYFLSADDPEELFIVIEINRQLGKFDKCMTLIQKADEKKHKRMKSIYMKEIERRNSKLFRIF